MKMLRRFLAAILLVACPTLAFGQAEFYETLYQRGIADYATGNFGAAVDEIRIAAFGMMEDVPRYQTAQIYLALLYDRLNRREEAVKAVTQVEAAEKIQPAFAALSLPPEIRKAYETLAPALLRGEGGTVADPGHGLSPADPIVVTPAPIPPPPVSTGTDWIGTLEAMLARDPSSVPLKTALAEAKLEAGNAPAARELAGQVLAVDPRNTSAHLVLARIDSAAGNSRGAVSHYDVVRAARKLDPEDTGRYFVALIGAGELDRGADVRGELPETAKQTPEVAAAIARLDAALAAAAPAPQPPIAPETISESTVTFPSGTSASPPAGTPQKPQKAEEPPAPATQAPKSGPGEAQAGQPARSPTPTQPSNAQPTAKPPAAAGQAPSTPPATPPVKSAPAEQPAKATPAADTADPDRAPSTPPPAAPPVKSANPAGSAKNDEVRRQLTVGERAVAEGKTLQARDIFLALAAAPEHPREIWLGIGRGLAQTSSWRDASAAYEKAGRLRQGEEIHLFYKAILLYELGDYARSKEYLRIALPRIPRTREVVEYQKKIESAR